MGKFVSERTNERTGEGAPSMGRALMIVATRMRMSRAPLITRSGLSTRTVLPILPFDGTFGSSLRKHKHSGT